LSQATKEEVQQGTIDSSLIVGDMSGYDLDGNFIKTGSLYVDPEKSPTITVGGAKMTIPPSCWIAKDP